MRIVLMGQAAFGEKALQALLERGEDVVAVYAPPDDSGKADPLMQLAVKTGISVFPLKGMRAPEVYSQYIKLKPDLNIMAFVTTILPESILNYPRYRTIQYHPSLLPRHRGGSAINWAIINGESRTGITIFWPDRGVDTGPILLQKEVAIDPDDTVGSLYFNRLFPLGIEAILESLELVKKGIAPVIPQDESRATCEGLCTEKDTVISWLEPAVKTYNLIRGANPQPGAVTWWGDKKFKVFDSELVGHQVAGLPGEVFSITDTGFIVAATGGAIHIKRVQPEGSGKIKAREFATQFHFKAGDRLGG